jgi:hypothetical protein
MKKVTALILLMAVVLALGGCSVNLTDKDDIIALFYKHEKSFLQAAQSGDYSALERIRGVQSIDHRETYVDITCGGAGFGPSTHYYGIFYTADDDLYAHWAAPGAELAEYGKGYLYQEEDGDNSYYVEPLGNHYFYYEAHF